jgi:hypothetical protein
MNIFGPPSEDPERYWRPELGYMNIGVRDIGLLTPQNLYDAYMTTRNLWRRGM